jgi:hypothetical protein
MSTLSQFAPFASGGLKSFQTGYVSTDSLSGSGGGEDAKFLDVTVSSVATAKAIPGGLIVAANYYNAFNASAGMRYSDTANSYGPVIMRLTSATNLRLSAPGVSIGFVGRWQVAEAN